MENLLKTVFARTALFAAKLVTPIVQPNYKPMVVMPGGAISAAQLEKVRMEASENSSATTATLLAARVRKGGKKVKNARAVDMKSNLLQVRETFATYVKMDPDSIASKIVLQMCDGMPGMSDLGNQRRVVQAWSAILAPSVVIRERDGVAITVQTIIEAGFSWIERGYTRDAQLAYEQSKSRFIAAHPARMYALLVDTAEQFDVDHQQLMISMLMPVIKALGSFEGAMRVLDLDTPKTDGSVNVQTEETPEQAQEQVA